MLSDYKLGFIGGGQVSEAILAGALGAGVLKAGNVAVADVSAERLAYLAETYGVAAVANAAGEDGAKRLLAQSGIVVLAVKPQVAPAVLAAIGPSFTAGQLVVSVMGGVRLESIEGYVPHSPVVRVMPNAPMAVGRGSAALCAGALAGAGHLALCEELFGAVGSSYVVPETLIDAFTAVGGCAPAFAYMFIQALADGGVKEGLPRSTALRAAAETVAGAAEMVLKTGLHPEQLKDNVCSPGGGTIAGVHALEQAGLRAAVMNAVAKSRRRMGELGKG